MYVASQSHLLASRRALAPSSPPASSPRGAVALPGTGPNTRAQPPSTGGATTSAAHTSVNIAPALEGVTVHVKDASRAVNTVGSLLSAERRDAYVDTVRAEQERQGPRRLRIRP